MRKNSMLFLALLFVSFQLAVAQTSSLVQPDVAIFYPKDFKAYKTLPSLAVTQDVSQEKQLPANWAVKA